MISSRVSSPSMSGIDWAYMPMYSSAWVPTMARSASEVGIEPLTPRSDEPRNR